MRRVLADRLWPHWAVCALLGAGACGGVPTWPVGVPPAATPSDDRAEAPLPLCSGQPSCPELDGLRRLLGIQASRCGGAGGARPASPELEELLQALAKAPPPSTGFPASFAAAPGPFREASAQRVVDARQEQLDPSAAVLFHGLWWTFWDRGAIPEDPTKASPFSHLIVFPDFEGRQPCKEW